MFAANVPFGPMLAIVGGCVAGSLLRAAYFLLTKQQRKAWDHLGAVAWLLRHPVLLWRRPPPPRRQPQALRGRSCAASCRGAGRWPGWPNRPRACCPAARPTTSGGLHHALIDEVGDDMPLPATDSVVRRVLTSPGVLLCAGLTLVALVAERSLAGSVLAGSGTLSGGALVPAWGGASDLWREYLAGYHDAGLGSAASTPPYVGVMAVLATLLAGKPWLAVDVLLFAAVPAAGLTAFLATRRVTSVLAARIWLAATYALLPVAMGAVAAGRIGTAVAFVLLPLIGIAAGRMLTGPPRRARRAAWAAGLLDRGGRGLRAAGVADHGPRRGRPGRGLGPGLGRATAINAAIVAVVPAAVLVPWTFHLVTSPSAFFLEAGIERPGLAAALRPESVLLLRPGGPGLPPAWVTAGLLLPAFGALLARRRLPLVYAGWAIALGGLAAALVVSRVRVTAPGGTAVSAWPGVATAIAAAGLLLAAAPLIEAAAAAVGRAGDAAAARRSPAGRLAALACSGGGGLGAGPRGRVLAGRGCPRTGGRGRTADPAALRGLLVLRARPAQDTGPAAGRRGPVLHGPAQGDPVLGEPELPDSSSATRALDGVVASLGAAAGGDGGDPGRRSASSTSVTCCCPRRSIRRSRTSWTARPGWSG